MSEIAVRAAKMSDEPGILALARQEMTALERMDPRFRLRPDSEGRYATYLRERSRDTDTGVLVAEENGRLIGLAIASIRSQNSFFEPSRYGYISDLLVLESERRRGIGTILFRRIMKWFRAQGITVARLHVASCNEAARAFWSSVGAGDYLVERWIDLSEESQQLAESSESIEEKRRDPAPASQGPGYSWGEDLVGGF
jgi:ribosomal protein S18 acetylase RimI-like enzyme